ncbi:MAG: alpha/beta hydrolase [Bacteroidota bacterium]
MKWKLFIGCSLLGLIGINILAYNHAHQFTHFSATENKRVQPESLSLTQKAKILFQGAPSPKPINTKTPNSTYKTITIEGEETLEAWWMEALNSKGIVLLFHGYCGNKSALVPFADVFLEMGFSTLLIDFRGSGGSTGNATTIGVKESQDVIAAYDYIQSEYPEQELILFGHSMGAAAIMRAMAKSEITPDRLILASPFGRMRHTIQQRFRTMGVPSFPFADLLMLHGGWQHDFNAYRHNPIDYAKSITIPTLLIHGQLDKRVTRAEIDAIFESLDGEKKLLILENSGHNGFLKTDAAVWKDAVGEFLE